MNDRLKGHLPGSRGEPSPQQMLNERSELESLLAEGDDRVKGMMAEASRSIYEVVENTLVTFQPDLFFLPQWLDLIPEVGLSYCREKIQSYAEVSQSGYCPELRLQSEGRYQGAIGAAIWMIERHYGRSSSFKRPMQ